MKGSITRGYLMHTTELMADLELFSLYATFLKDPGNSSNPPWMFQQPTVCSDAMKAASSYSATDAWNCFAKTKEVEELSRNA